ncbi:hypothetical protein OPT61_g9073 [Boeremia exigua]|uniref:Uncharacterized protein n=1 Tax=Boeremia exigua TaxID=749465 RepID=A0ACC2HWG5_9PLEO|nr:hypothetical protein OPT61_g9073 [Boeremia exigua]
MRFFQMVASSAAFIAAALALEINNYPTGGVQAGQTYTITYSPADNTPTTFILRKGLSTDLDTVGTLTSTATGGTFSWTVDRSLANGADYALEIRQDGETPNYSGQFGLTGGSAAASSSASAASASSVASVISSRASSASSAASASASLSSLISSVVSSVQATATGGATTASTNGTVTSATLSRSATGSRATGSATGSASIPESTGAASSLSSAPLALFLGAVGAFAFLN